MNNNRQSQRNIKNYTTCVLNEDNNLSFAVWEMSSHGFSFLAPINSHFFPEAIFKQIEIINADNIVLIRTNNAKVVHVSKFDEKTQRIGIKYGKIKHDRTLFKNIRPTRIKTYSDIPIKCACRVMDDNNFNVFFGFLNNYNASSLKITFNDKLTLQPNTLIHLKIVILDNEIFDGNGTIIRSENTSLVVKLNDSFLDILKIDELISTNHFKNVLNTSLEPLKKYSKVDNNFKALLNDWSLYFARLKSTIDKEEQKELFSTPEAEILLIQRFEERVIDDLNNFVARLNITMEAIASFDYDLYGEYLKECIGNYLLTSPQVIRMKDTPNGYHGDYETIKNYFSNYYEGKTLFGKLINKWVSMSECVQGHVNRIDFIYETLTNLYYNSNVEPFKVFVLGSGPAEEITRFIKEQICEREIIFTLMDMDAVGLTDFANRIQYFQKNKIKFDYCNCNVLDFFKDGLKNIDSVYDFTYCAGMLDYFSDKKSKEIVKMLYDKTKIGGTYLFTNVHISNHFRHFMRLATGWKLKHRSTKEFESFSPEGSNSETYLDSTGTNIIIYGKK